MKIKPIDHVRDLTLNKIRINNASSWDVAKYKPDGF